MRLNIEINLDNEAYQESGWEFEVEKNLQSIVKRLLIDARSGTIQDSNGNKTGHWIMIDHEQECGK